MKMKMITFSGKFLSILNKIKTKITFDDLLEVNVGFKIAIF